MSITSVGAWVIRIVAAFLVFFVVKWLLPLLASALHSPVPDTIVTLVALLLALVVLFGNLWWGRVFHP